MTHPAPFMWVDDHEGRAGCHGGVYDLPKGDLLPLGDPPPPDIGNRAVCVPEPQRSRQANDLHASWSQGMHSMKTGCLSQAWSE